MYVLLHGQDAAGQRQSRSWQLLAEGDDGPLIPVMAVAALLRRWLAGEVPRPGARPALREVELADFEALFAPRRIHTAIS